MAHFHEAQTPDDVPEEMQGEPDEQAIPDEQYRAAARALHQVDGECEIDSDAKVSVSSDGGAYVQAWVWVDDSDATGGGR